MNNVSGDQHSTSDDPTVLGSGSGSAESGAVLVQLMEECLIKLEAGETVDQDQLLARHPELASQLEACLASLRFIHKAVQPAEGIPTRLADFRIIREIGRGGMGVVYEAEQVSLKRPVALKILRFGAVADQEAMQRFQREAETIASLHHTNIVPVFAVGVENSIHYYAMQLIEGHSLQEMAQQSRQTPIPDKTIAKWGLQAAEALAHAHERHVVHRDIKPSNLILGTDGRIWLTDFGLAKRLDDVTLSLCGALLGTPRYMSPEQASAMRHPVDHRTDIYSLGATLYELVTGRPLFDSESPHVVISQILTTDPRPPRELTPGISRDLETIILKCLCKDAGRRYQSARDLAEDLRAFEDGRAIKARRASFAERAGRWMKQNRRLLVATTTAVAATIACIVVGASWWQIQSASRNGFLTLTTKEGPLTAEVFTESGEPVIPSFTVPNEQPMPIPAGDYQLRVSGRGALSKTGWFQLDRFEKRDVPVDVDRKLRYPGIPLDSLVGYEFIDFGTGLDLIALPGSPNETNSIGPASQQVDARMLRRISGATGKEVWSLNISQTSPAMQSLLPTEELRSLWWRSTVFGWKLTNKPPLRVLRPLLDLDSDGTPDLVWLHHQGYSLFAVSGKTGQPLWWHHFSEKAEPGPRLQFESAALAEILQADGLKVPVVVITEVGRNPTDGTATAAFVTAINARDKSLLWRQELPAASASMAIAKSKSAGGDLVVVISQGRLLTFDLASGDAVGQPFTLDPADDPRSVVYSPPRILDVDGDGQMEVLLTRGEPNPNPFGVRVVSRSAAGPGADSSRPNWFVPFTGDNSKNYLVEHHDLNGDGQLEVILTSEQSEFDCRVLKGQDGSEIWRRRRPGNVFKGRHSPPVIGDDLDGDGWREVFTVSTEPKDRDGLGIDSPNLLYADCFSGRDGKTLWWSKTPAPAKSASFLPPFAIAPRWWRHGPDGTPALLVTTFLESKSSSIQASVFTIAAATGEFREYGADLANPEPVDVDGDGLEELAVAHRTDDGHTHHLSGMAGELRVFQSENPVAWRRFGDWQPLLDLDGDGILELWQPRHRVGNQLPIVSGRDGTLLTEWTIDHRTSNLIPLNEPLVDLDQDGRPELLALNETRSEYLSVDKVRLNSMPMGLELISSKTRRPIWVAPKLTIPDWQGTRQIQRRIAPPRLLDLDGDKKLELVVSYYWHLDQELQPPSPARGRFCLAVLDVETGRLKWEVDLLEEQEDSFSPWLSSIWFEPVQFGDLNNDGVLDLLVALSAPPWHSRMKREMIVQAINGRDGSLLWPEFRSRYHQPDQGFENLLQVGVGNVDGQPGDEVIRLDFVADAESGTDLIAGNLVLEVLEGRSGEPRFFKRWPVKLQPHASLGELQRLWILRHPERDQIVVTRAKFNPHSSSFEGNEDWSLAVPANASGEGVTELETLAVCEAHRNDRSWKFDLNADGNDELVSWRNGRESDSEPRLVVTRGLTSELWNRQIARLTGYSQAKIQLLDQGQILLVSLGQMNVVLSGDGQLLSQFPSPADAGVEIVPGTRGWIGGWASGSAPRVIVREGSQTRSDWILARDEQNRVLPISLKATPKPAQGLDPRIARELPWVRGVAAQQFGFAMLFAAILIWLFVIAPFGVLRWGWRRRHQWGPRIWTGLVAVMWAGAVWWQAGRWTAMGSLRMVNLLEVGTLFLIGAPLACVPGLVVRWSRTRRLWPVVGLASAIVVATLVTAGLAIWFDARLMHPAEQYSREGWYWILFPGAGLGIALTLVLRWCWLGGRAACRRLFRARRLSVPS